MTTLFKVVGLADNQVWIRVADDEDATCLTVSAKRCVNFVPIVGDIVAILGGEFLTKEGSAQ